MAESWPTEAGATKALHGAASKAWDDMKQALPTSLQVPFDDLPMSKQHEIKSALLPIVWAALEALPDERRTVWLEGYICADNGGDEESNPYPEA